MNRHAALFPLSLDHHHALQHAARLDKAADTGPQPALAASRAYLNWHTTALLGHLDEEEGLLLPLVEPALQARYQTLVEQLRNAADELRISLMDPTFFRPAVRAVARELKAHVACCEGDLFLDIQAGQEPGALDALAKRTLAYRKVHRPFSLGEPPTEPTYL